MHESASVRCYVYCVVPANGAKEFGNIGIGGRGEQVYTIDYKDIAAVVSNTSEEEFERSEENIVAHQRVVQTVFDKQLGVPLAFATLTRSREQVQQLLEERYTEFRDKLTKLATLGADGSQVESNQPGTKQLIEEALSQSAAGAVKIRQLNEEISQLRSMRYEKLMETAAEVIMKRFSANISTTLASLTHAIEGLQERVENLKADSSGMDTDRGPERIHILDREIRVLREKIERLNSRTDKFDGGLDGIRNLDNEIQAIRVRMERLNRRSVEDVLAQTVLSGD